MSEGFHVTANVYRSKKAADAGEPMPVVMCAHPYDNHLTPELGTTPLGGPPQQYRIIPQAGKPVFSRQTSWESPDPNHVWPINPLVCSRSIRADDSDERVSQYDLGPMSVLPGGQ